MNKKINALIFLPVVFSTLLMSCSRTAKDLITTGDYYFEAEKDLVLKSKNFKSSKPDTYQLELSYFHLTIEELTYESYLSINAHNDEINEQMAKGDYSLVNDRITIFSPENEFIYFKSLFSMELKLYEYASDNDPNPVLKKTTDKSINIYGTYIGRYNHTLNTYYFLLDFKDPCYEDASSTGETESTLLLVSLFINNPQEVSVRLSSRTGSLYSTSERWAKSFKLEYEDPVDPDKDDPMQQGE